MTDADDLDYLESLLDEPFKQKNTKCRILFYSNDGQRYFLSEIDAIV